MNNLRSPRSVSKTSGSGRIGLPGSFELTPFSRWSSAVTAGWRAARCCQRYPAGRWTQQSRRRARPPIRTAYSIPMPAPRAGGEPTVADLLARSCHGFAPELDAVATPPDVQSFSDAGPVNKGRLYMLFSDRPPYATQARRISGRRSLLRRPPSGQDSALGKSTGCSAMDDEDHTRRTLVGSRGTCRS
jgi:hypothetical protein